LFRQLLDATLPPSLPQKHDECSHLVLHSGHFRYSKSLSICRLIEGGLAKAVKCAERGRSRWALSSMMLLDVLSIGFLAAFAYSPPTDVLIVESVTKGSPPVHDVPKPIMSACIEIRRY
jgi:hypothetical protein